MDGYILIIDNRKIFRSAIKNILINKGYKTIGIGNGKTAIDRIRQNDIEMVILKHDLPGWSSLKTLRKIKAEFPDLIVVCIADGLDEETSQKYNNNGIEYIVSKRLVFGETEKFIKKLPLE
ncbi:MAG: response regulator [Candidatus Marinimicrobia bacterium]|nr:response regulator [Candidatus Neomarinimicrobiota bacterium]